LNYADEKNLTKWQGAISKRTDLETDKIFPSAGFKTLTTNFEEAIKS